ncbi:Zn(2)-C6 fungal-type domain-containing protein [Fusarium sp. LHS14.1]|nr:Zn(2)-C6 fungal-type domain-containing protein [Fusarium sp. LHS14.1]
MDTRSNKRQRNNSTNSHAQRTTPSTAQDQDESPGQIPLANRPAPVPAHESPANSNEAPALEMRSCENCRRGKLKCSRSYPCAKCLDKGLDCVYEQDKRRGPKPGYIEEIYRRIDVLEQMVIGQSLLMRPQHQSSESRPDFRSVVDGTRQMLREVGQHTSRDGTTDDATLSRGARLSRVQQDTANNDSPAIDMSDATIGKMCHVYRTQIQPWIPVLQPQFFFHAQGYVGQQSTYPCGLQMEALMAATGPFLGGGRDFDRQEYLRRTQVGVCEKLLTTADMNTLHACTIIQFLLLGDGRMTSYWGLVTMLPQVALRAGLHLEDQHLSPEQLEYRRLMSLVVDNSSWRSRESTRRLFWVLFLLEQFAALLSGTKSSFDPNMVRRLLPCDGQLWLENRQVQTREFIQANVAAQVQITPDPSIGGLAYLIEATEILTMVNSFARTTTRAKTPFQDPRGFLREFLNLDLVLANWKSRLPARYQHASPDKNGYIDHNMTLAHLTHNTSGILLYQAPRAFCRPQPPVGSNSQDSSSQSTLMAHVALVTQAAKEIGKICTRFLLHRRYLVSGQFSFCQFIAARALLAYSSWLMEPVDDDFETILTSLAESSKRWNSSQHNDNSELHQEPAQAVDFAAQLLSRLKIDAQKPEAIDLTASWTTLSAEMEGVGQPQKDTSTDRGSVVEWRGQQGHDNDTADDGLLPMSLSTSTLDLMTPLDVDGSLSMLASSQIETLDDRIFSWRDYSELPVTVTSDDQGQFYTNQQPQHFQGL